MKNIIKNNYEVVKLFDDCYDGSVKKYLSKEEANLLISRKIKGHYISYRARECAAVIGIVPMNGGEAFIFNKEPKFEISNQKLIDVAYGVYEDLIKCYVFISTKMPESVFKKLKDEYFIRGGQVFEKYHSYEDEILNLDKNKRNKAFKQEIIEHIFKHQFREVGRDKWSNINGFVVKQVNTNRISTNYHSENSSLHVENINLDSRVLINSIFSTYSNEVTQLSERVFSIPCKKDKYLFCCFEITIN